jgi:Protein of unknown function (DUF2971)
MGPAADSIPVRVPSSYVFCLSEHAKDDTDGRLSMWRGYGGNGSGAAIVFDTAKIAAREEMSLVIRHVHYGTAQDSQLLPLGLGITLFAREKALVAVKADAGKRREGSRPHENRHAQSTTLTTVSMSIQAWRRAARSTKWAATISLSSIWMNISRRQGSPKNKKSPLFRADIGRTGKLSDQSMSRVDA